MSAERRTAAYLILADRGLRSAKILFREEQFEDATLFIQQIVERIARALLTHAGIAFGTSHNLGQMASALPDGHHFKDRILLFDDLSGAVTAYRYPADSGRLKNAPDVETLRQRLADVEQLLHDAKVVLYGADPSLWPTLQQTRPMSKK